MDSLINTIKFCRVARIELNLTDYGEVELLDALRCICIEARLNEDNDAPLKFRVPNINRAVTLDELRYASGDGTWMSNL